MDWGMFGYGLAAGGVVVAVVDYLIGRKRVTALRDELEGKKNYIDNCHQRLGRMAQLHQQTTALMTDQQKCDLAFKLAGAPNAEKVA